METVRRDVAFRDQPDLFSYTPPQAKPQVVAVAKPPAATRTAKMRQMLSMLNSGDSVSSNTLHEIDRRAAATICNLREMGHLIESFNVGDETFYRYAGYERKVSVSDRMKAAYYETSHWRYIAGVRRETDGYACQQCKAKKGIQVHHWVYNLFNENPRYDLITFCDGCHESWHAALTGSRIHFPRYVSEEIATKLGWKQ